MSRILSAFAGAVVEAWAELRIHKTRVLLSLIGVAIAVAALTAVVALTAIAQQSSAEQFEREGGRPATLMVSLYAKGTQPLDLAIVDAVVQDVRDRYKISWDSPNAYSNARVQLIDGVTDVSLQLVGEDYATMHRTLLDQGVWFTDRDAQRLAPAIVVNEAMWQRMGQPSLESNPVIEMVSPNKVTAVVIGIVPARYPEEGAAGFMLYEPFVTDLDPAQAAMISPQWEFWVPEELALDLQTSITSLATSKLGDQFQADVFRSDYAANGMDPFEPIRLVAGGIALLVLFLGALSLVNISLVTIRQRIREIGIRRSFGATAGRVFFAVMMESVVATLAAGIVGVFAAVLLVRSPVVLTAIAPGIIDIPAFPVEAALVGLASATIVGALAGLLPALVAVRVKVIDAIRY